MQDFIQALPLIRAIVGRYLDGQDSLDEAAASLAGVLRRGSPYYQAAGAFKEPTVPTTGRELRKLSPEQWMNPMVEKGITITLLSIVPGEFSPEGEEQAIACSMLPSNWGAPPNKRLKLAARVGY